jgi:uncharacterized repeat protein (TIGR02543 family)
MRHLIINLRISGLIFLGILLSNCSSDSITPSTPIQKVKYTIFFTADTGGSVSTSGGSYEQGSSVSVTATPQSGYVFTGWSDGNTNATRTITVSSNTTISATFAALPTVSTLSFPDNNKVCQEGTNVSDTQSTINFQWSASDNTTSYDLIINNIASEAVTRYDDISVTNKEVTLDTAKSYSWRVVSKSNKTTQTATSILWQFYLAGQGEENFAPYPATIISPASGATVTATDGQITLQWTGEDPDQDTLVYTIYIDAIDGLQDTNGTIPNLTATEVNYQVTTGTVYYWRVKSSDGSSSSFTQVYSFRVE